MSTLVHSRGEGGHTWSKFGPRDCNTCKALLNLSLCSFKKAIQFWKITQFFSDVIVIFVFFLINLNLFSLSDEYERAVATVNQLTQQIEDLKEATRDDSETVDTLKRKLETSLRDNDRMSKQNKDLGKIVDFFCPLYFMI